MWKNPRISSTGIIESYEYHGSEIRQFWYGSMMTPLAKSLLDRVASWPDEDVAELDGLARNRSAPERHLRPQ
jgi:hypothetical protein